MTCYPTMAMGSQQHMERVAATPRGRGPIGSFHMLLIKHMDSTDTSSHQTNSVLRRTYNDAVARIKKIREKVCAPSDFNVKVAAKPKEIKKRFIEAARAQSDHPSSSDGGSAF